MLYLIVTDLQNKESKKQLFRKNLIKLVDGRMSIKEESFFILIQVGFSPSKKIVLFASVKAI